MGSLQTMMAMAMVDAATRTRRDGERELLVQGLSNIGAGCLGTLQSCGAISRSRVNIDAGGSRGASRAAFGLGLVLLLGLGSALLRHVPMAAIAGVFVAVAFTLVDGWSRRATGVIARRLAHGEAPPRLLGQSYAVMLLVAGTTVFVSLSHGLVVGVLAAMVMFIRSNSRHPIRSISHGDRRLSRKVRPARTALLLREHGRRIAVLELDGPLFFGTADVAAREIGRLGSEADQIVIDFTRVSEVDASGARVLLQAAHELAAGGRRLLLAALPEHDLRRRTIHEMDVHEALADADFFDDADLALECAEDRLLHMLAPPPEESVELPLGSTMLGAGLPPEDIETLASMLVRIEVPRGQHVFRSGDESDAMFVSVSGQIGIWLPGAHPDGAPRQRLVSFAPGVVFGEMGLLERRPRSADAVAEDDTVVLALSREVFEHLSAHRPAIVGRLLLNLSVHLSARVRALTAPAP
jgi:SulP family sulfate permease